MGLQSYLAVNCQGTPAAYTMVGATPTQIGNNFPATAGWTGGEPAPPDLMDRISNRIIKFNNGLTGASETQLVAWVGNGVFSYNESSPNWTPRLIMTGPDWNGPISGQEYAHSGLHVVEIAGVPTLFGVAQSSGGGLEAFTTTDCVTFNRYTSAIAPGYRWLSECLFNNVLYFATATYLGQISFDPATGNWTSNSGASPGDGNSVLEGGQDMCVFKNALYKVAPQHRGSSPPYYSLFALWVLSAGTWVNVGVLPIPPTGIGYPAVLRGNRPILFDGGPEGANNYLYAIYQDVSYTPIQGQYGCFCGKIDVTGLSATITDISSTVLPASWLFPTSAGSFGFESAMEIASNPGNPTGPVVAQPVIHIWIANAITGVPWNYYTWNGPGALIGNGGIPEDIGGNASMSIPDVKCGSEDRIYETGDFSIRILSITGTVSQQVISFQAGSPLGNDNHNVMFYYSINGEEPYTPCPLTAVTGGSATLGGDLYHVANVTCNMNTGSPTTYTATWNSSAAVSPGPVPNFQAVNLLARVYV
jgi:hypothetical protein